MARLAFARQGTGPPLVLIHALGSSRAAWDPVVARLGERFDVIAVDLPGFGASDCPTRPRLSAYAEDIVEGLEALAIGECTVVGHSLGGGIAVAVAERSDAVRALALLGARRLRAHRHGRGDGPPRHARA